MAIVPRATACRTRVHRLAELSSVGGGAGRSWKARRLARHVGGCPSCAAQVAALRASTAAASGVLRALLQDREADFVSVRHAVRARLDQQPAPRGGLFDPARRGGWSLALPAAAMMTGLAVLILRPGPVPSSQRDATTPAVMRPASGAELSSSVDGVVRVEISEPTGEPHRVAVSTRAWDFSKAEVFEVEGRSWVDSTPDPPSGQAYFYRVD